MGSILEKPTAHKYPRIIDATLREGSQAAGAVFDAHASAEIAAILASLGVDAIECGHPAISGAERDRIRAVRSVLTDTRLLCHARAKTEDIQHAADVGADWVGIFIGVSPLSRMARHNLCTEDEVRSRIHKVVAEALKLGLSVRFSVEDASRTESETANAAYRIALDAGAKRICFTDTVGILTPEETKRRVAELATTFPDTPIEVHLHDDRGLAQANALAALEAGAGWISTSVNGLGERCGIVDLAALAANLSFEGLRDIERPELLHKLSAWVGAYSRASADARRPVVGRNAFTHTSRLHQIAVECDPTAYEWLDPTLIGRARKSAAPITHTSPEALITIPPVISATELKHHRKGPGERYVMIDQRFVDDCRQYCIVRRIPQLEDYGPGHVDKHAHVCDSLFLFMGEKKDLKGLTVEVTLGETQFSLESPVSIFIPAGLSHSYRVLSGSGLFVNHVLAGSYNDSLLDSVLANETSG